MRRFLATICLAVVATFFFVSSEWLFFVTKPSFLSPLGIVETIRVMLATAALTALLAIPATLAISIPGAALLHVARPRQAWATLLPDLPLVAVPAALAAFSVMLLVDNFTYTLAHFNAGSSTGLVRHLYLAAYLLLYLALLRRMARWIPQTGPVLYVSALVLMLSGMAACLLARDAQDGASPAPTTAPALAERAPGKATRPPNILILSSDGINARNMSVYGYERDTTPYIRSIADRGLLAENAFSNSASSTGSIISMLTGKAPLTTRVIFRPDMLRGVHQHQHFVGLLHRRGYFTADLGVPWYTDPQSLGMKDAFDVTTDALLKSREYLIEIALYEYADRLPGRLSNEATLLQTSAERVQSRLYHVFGLRDMNNPFSEVSLRTAGAVSDHQRIQSARDIIAKAAQPWFLHVHFMDTHGPRFKVRSSHFSAGSLQTQNWMTDFYDDAILNYDQRVREFFELLDTTGQLDDTIVVLTSDHGIRHLTTERVPLIVFFPGGEHAGRITRNVQRLDLPPTLLEFLGIERPDWIEGNSLLQSLPADRLIVGALPAKTDTGQLLDYSPPFFGLGGVYSIQCQRYHELPLRNDPLPQSDVLLATDIPGHTQPCESSTMLQNAGVYEALSAAMTASGYPQIVPSGPVSTRAEAGD